jgi:hypothetical protein
MGQRGPVRSRCPWPSCMWFGWKCFPNVHTHCSSCQKHLSISSWNTASCKQTSVFLCRWWQSLKSRWAPHQRHPVSLLSHPGASSPRSTQPLTTPALPSCRRNSKERCQALLPPTAPAERPGPEPVTQWPHLPATARGGTEEGGDPHSPPEQEAALQAQK